MTPHFFLSYAREDDDPEERLVSNFFKKLCSEITAHGMKCEGFIDTDTLPAERWDTKILSALCESGVLVVLVSPNYCRSEYCERELDIFEHRMRKTGVQGRVLPVVWLNTPRLRFPSRLERINYTLSGGDSRELECFDKYNKNGIRSFVLNRAESASRYRYNCVIEKIAQRIVEISATPFPPLPLAEAPQFYLGTAASASPEPIPRKQQAQEPVAVSLDPDDYANLTATAAKNDDDAIRDIAALIGEDRDWVRDMLHDVHGACHVRTVFEEWWPTEDVDEEWSTREIGKETVATARGNNSIISAIVQTTGLAQSTVEKRLKAAHGKTLVSNLFKQWPNFDEIDSVGALTVASCRNDSDLTNFIARTVELAESDVDDVLETTSGQTLIRNAFDDWP